METLTKKNFWNEIELKFPKSIIHFKEWIDQYKKDNKWQRLFNVKIVGDAWGGHIDGVAPKYHELPVAMQFGIFLEYSNKFAKEHGLDINYTVHLNSIKKTTIGLVEITFFFIERILTREEKN